MGLYFVYPYAFLLFVLYLLTKLSLKQIREGVYFSRVDILQKVFRKQGNSILITEVLLIFSLSASLSYPTATVFKTYTQSDQDEVFMLLNLEDSRSKKLAQALLERIEPAKVSICALLKSFKKVVPLTDNIEMASKIIQNLRVIDDEEVNLFSAMTSSISLKKEGRTSLYLVGFDKKSVKEEREKLKRYIPLVDVFVISQSRDIDGLKKERRGGVVVVKERKPYFLYPLFLSIFLLLFYIYLQNRIRGDG